MLIHLIALVLPKLCTRIRISRINNIDHSYVIIISYYPQLLSCMPASKTFSICAPNDIRQNSQIMENYIIIDGETNM